MANPQYPHDILPRKSWKKGILLKDVISCCPNALIGRWLEGPKESFLDDSLGDDMVALFPEALPVKSVPNLSCCLLGALFLYEHFHYHQINEGNKPWVGNTDIADDMLTTDNYIFMPKVTVIGWMINEVERYTIEYEHVFQKKKDYDKIKSAASQIADNKNIDVAYLKEWEELTSDPSNEKNRIAELKGGVRVNHDPTNMNYWHFTIDSYPAESEVNPLKNASDGWRKNMAVNLVDFLRRSFVHITESTTIPAITNSNVWEK